MSVTSPTAFEPDRVRLDFPLLAQEVNGQPLLYLDNAATAQKPRQVLEESQRYYEEYNSNIHRGTHHLSQLATTRHEAAREQVARFLNASPEEVIFTSGTTDGINLVASILGLSGRIQEGDELLLSGLEHHSNIVPWQMLAEQTGAVIRVIPVLEDGTLDQERYAAMLTEKVKLVAITHISNAFGTISPVKEMIEAAHGVGSLVMLDGAQSVPHGAVDLKALGADFFAFSGHKLYAPTGIGVLYGKKNLLEALPPWKGGGEMIKEVSFEGTTYNDLPFKYEAGTPNIEGAIALGAAINYLTQFDKQEVNAHERALITNAAQRLSEIPEITLYGPPDRIASLSFTVEGVHHYDLGTLLDQMGVAVRTGHHCCQPLMARFGITGTTRASFAFYNTLEEVDHFATALRRSLKMLR